MFALDGDHQAYDVRRVTQHKAFELCKTNRDHFPDISPWGQNFRRVLTSTHCAT